MVYKTPDAQLVGQGLAGTIDLRTVRPLDYGRQAVVLNLRGEKNSHSDGDLGADHDDTGYRASLSYIDQFMDGTLGVAFGYARLDSPIATKGFGTYEPWKPMGNDNNPNTSPGFPSTALKTDGMKVRTDMGDTVRDGLMAAVQYEPNDFYSTTVDAYYSTMDQTDNARSIEVNLSGYPAPCCDGPFPNGTIFGFSEHHAGEQRGGVRQPQHGRAAGPQLPVQDRGRDPGGRLAQRVPAERRVEAAGRHQLLEGDPRAGPVRDQRADQAGSAPPPRGRTTSTTTACSRCPG